jgi:site-specific recombinase XerD
MRNNLPIAEFCESFLEEANRKGYANASIKIFKRSTNLLIEYAAQKDVSNYSIDFGKEFLAAKYKGIELEHVERPHSTRAALRAVAKMDDFLSMENLTHRRLDSQKGLTDDDVALLSRFSDDCAKRNYASATTGGRMHHAKQFLCYLFRECRNLTDITENDIIGFVNAAPWQSQVTKALILQTMKQFLLFLYEEGILQRDMRPLLPQTHRRQLARIPSVWKESDITKLLGSIDRGSPVGKRDYAILLLVANLGLRAGDVFNLKKENINWKDCRLEFVQSKTKQPALLPLPDNVGWAIIEYLKDGRPKIESSFIFVSHSNNSWGEKLKSSYGYILMEKYIRIAGIRMSNKQRHGFHSLRHSLACRLLEAKTPLPVISGVLCQLSPEMVEKYLKVDVESLRQCAINPGEVFINASTN